MTTYCNKCNKVPCKHVEGKLTAPKVQRVKRVRTVQDVIDRLTEKNVRKVKAWAIVYGDNYEGICSHAHDFKDKIGFCLNITTSKLVANVIASKHRWRVVPVTIHYPSHPKN